MILKNIQTTGGDIYPNQKKFGYGKDPFIAQQQMVIHTDKSLINIDKELIQEAMAWVGTAVVGLMVMYLLRKHLSKAYFWFFGLLGLEKKAPSKSKRKK